MVLALEPGPQPNLEHLGTQSNIEGVLPVFQDNLNLPRNSNLTHWDPLSPYFCPGSENGAVSARQTQPLGVLWGRDTSWQSFCVHWCLGIHWSFLTKRHQASLAWAARAASRKKQSEVCYSASGSSEVRFCVRWCLRIHWSIHWTVLIKRRPVSLAWAERAASHKKQFWVIRSVALIDAPDADRATVKGQRHVIRKLLCALTLGKH